MIRCNLSILLAEQKLKITKVSNDTGISRTTLTALANNYGQGIQFDTINKLCIYLKVGPEQLLSFVPVDVKIKDIPLDIKSVIKTKSSISEIKVMVTEKNRQYECYICGNIDVCFQGNEIYSISVDIELWNPDDNEHIRKDIEEENRVLINAFKQLNRPFISDLENYIFSTLIFQLEYEYINDEGGIDKYTVSDNVDFSCNWPSELL